MVEIDEVDSSDEEEEKQKPLTKEEEERLKNVDLTQTPQFQNVFQEAAKMKTAQLKTKRQTYEAAPEWFKSTMFADETVKNARSEEASHAHRLAVAMDYKREGNKHFKADEHEAAIAAYVKGISIFKYFKHEKGSDYLPLVSSLDGMERGGDRTMAEELVVHCLLNVAACLLKQKKFPDAVYACNEVLKLDAKNVKAFYRRGMSYIGQDTSVSLEMGVSDLKKAAAIDPENVAVKAELRKHKVELKKQNAKDAEAYGGALKNGRLYTETDYKKFKEPAPKPPMPPVDPRVAKQLAEEKRRIAREQKRAAKKGPAGWVLEGPPFTRDQIDEAAKEGIDLNDPRVVRELKKMREEYKKTGGKMDKMNSVPEDGQAAGGVKEEGDDEDDEWLYEPFTDEIKAKAKEMGLDLDDPATVANMREVAKAKREGREPDESMFKGSTFNRVLQRLFDKSQWLSLPTLMYFFIFGNVAMRMFRLYYSPPGAGAQKDSQFEQDDSFDAWQMNEEL